MTNDMTQSPDCFHIEQLLEASAFPHSVSGLRLIETHISWVILTGVFAYKIKKPVKFDFVDYSTLEQRRINCHKEVELNQRYSTGIYLDVVPIFTQNGSIRVGESCLDPNGETPIEFAVKMREFSQESILAQLLSHGDLPSAQMEQFAETVAEFHENEPAISVDDLDAEIEKMHAEVNDNFAVLRPSLSNTSQEVALEKIAGWSEEMFHRLKPKVRERIQSGFLKSCHGDLHLNNIIQFDDKLVPFDGIEFNRHLQTIDTFNEVAFLFMDLMAHGYIAHAWRFLNAYLEIAGGYDCLDLFRFFSVYRAMVRAKVAWINCQSSSTSSSSSTGHPSSWLKNSASTDDAQREPVHPWDHYLDFAEGQLPRRNQNCRSRLDSLEVESRPEHWMLRNNRERFDYDPTSNGCV